MREGGKDGSQGFIDRVRYKLSLARPIKSSESLESIYDINLEMMRNTGGEHPVDSFEGLPDAHVTVRYLTPKSKVSHKLLRSSDALYMCPD